jgi:hypothetical protein
LNILDSPPFPTPGTHAGALNRKRAERGDGTRSCRESRLVDLAVSVVTVMCKTFRAFLELLGVTAPPLAQSARTIGHFEAVENPPLEGFAGS